MTGPRLTLVADDPRLAGALLTHLEKALGLVLWQCPFEAAGRSGAADGDGLLLLACGSAADSEPALRFVQEVQLRRLPAALVLLESDAARAGTDLSSLDPYLTRRLRWPAEAATLVQVVRDRAALLPHVMGLDDETSEEKIRRRLTAQTPSLLPMADHLALAARHDITVLLTGETGAGKTYLARLMHDCSARRAQPFLAVPCGAQPPNLLESAFFGHVRGAFTGADRSRVGKFEAAGEGTLLLDEIDAIPPEQQAALLRVIETGEFEPVGGNEVRRCRARIIAASNRDLEEAVRQGKFRQDLFYRLNVMSFHLPPLCERVQDVAPLARGMAARFNMRFRKDLFDVGADAVEALEAFPWPGNIRQLENVVQQAVLVSDGPELRLDHLPPDVRQHFAGRPGRPGGPRANRLAHNCAFTEQNVIRRALASNGYSRSRAAAALGVSRITLYKKMKKYGLMREPSR